MLVEDGVGPYINANFNDRLEGLLVDLDHEVRAASYNGWLDGHYHREQGWYRHGTAQANLIQKNRFGKGTAEELWIELRCTRVRDGVYLLHAIKTGRIRPYDSYEHGQVASPARETREMLRQLKEVWLNWWHTRMARTSRPAKTMAVKADKPKKTKWLSPRLDRMFRCQAPRCGAVHHGSKLGRNVFWFLLACPEPGCGAAVKPVNEQK